jgi:hypothetical protein
MRALSKQMHHMREWGERAELSRPICVAALGATHFASRVPHPVHAMLALPAGSAYPVFNQMVKPNG